MQRNAIKHSTQSNPFRPIRSNYKQSLSLNQLTENKSIRTSIRTNQIKQSDKCWCPFMPESPPFLSLSLSHYLCLIGLSLYLVCLTSGWTELACLEHHKIRVKVGALTTISQSKPMGQTTKQLHPSIFERNATQCNQSLNSIKLISTKSFDLLVT